MLNELRRWIDPRVASVQVNEVCAYLLKRGWIACPSPLPHQLVFEEPPGHADGPTVVHLPTRESLADYPQRMVELITQLAEIEDRYAVAVLDDILCHRSNAGGSSNGAVPAVLATN